MQAPHLYETAAFDAALPYPFSFSWTGSQPMGNRLTVRKNEDNTVVYSRTNTTMRQLHTLPANTLVNGTCYNAYVEVLNQAGGVISDQSNVIVFYCYSAPVFTFDGLTDNAVIENSSFTATVNYTQPEGELLSQYQVGLYDSSHSLIMTQGIQYLSAETHQVSALITGLENNTSYFVRATGKTMNNMLLDTGYIQITAKYLKPSMFTLINLENAYSNGYVVATSNLVTLRGASNPPEDKLVYLDESLVDLSTPGAYVEFSEGFTFSENFSLGAAFRGARVNLPLLTLSNGQYSASLHYREGCFESQSGALKGYFELLIDSAAGKIIVTCDYIEPIKADDDYTVWIIRVGNIYKLLFKKEV